MFTTLPRSPLYDPKSKIKKFIFDEDIEEIRLKISGTKQLWTDPKFSMFHYDHEVEWKRPKEFCRRPFFIRGRPERFDALQGQLGDCWFVVAMEALTTHDQLVQHVVPRDQSFDHNYIGAFHFRIWKLGTWYDVVVDDRLPYHTGYKMLCYAHSKNGDVFWAALLEKAYAKICCTSTFSYDNLNIGSPMTSFQDLSGGIVDTMVVQKELPFYVPLKWFINEVFVKQGFMACTCYDTIPKSTGLVTNHFYTVTKVFKCANDDPIYPGFFLIRLLNPWGTKEWRGNWNDDHFNYWKQIDSDIKAKIELVNRDDGEFWIDENDFLKYFEAFAACYLGPGQYATSHRGDRIGTWSTTTFTGEWVKSISAGGSLEAYRHENPQYRILLKYPDNYANENFRVQTVIELVQRSKKGRDVYMSIGFYIYSLTDVHNPPMPLDRSFMAHNDPLDKNPDFPTSYGRSYVRTLSLEPGKYCIIPCTQIRNDESQFLLRVFSESRVELWEYDTKISKSFPLEEQSPYEYDEGLQKLFHDMAQGQNEIDWIELKEILEAAMNPKRSFIELVFKFIQDGFDKYLSLRTSNNHETGDVVFTKDECRSMIAMLDDNHSGKLSFSEFSILWNKICFWTKVYEQQRDEMEGYVKVAQLREALSSMGYAVNKRTVHSLSYVYADDHGNIFLTDFILCGITLETVLALYDKEDVEDDSKITFSLSQWVKNTLTL